MAHVYSKADGLIAADLIHCGLDHMTAAGALFGSDPSHFDSAGYLAHIGVELLLKGWLLEAAGRFDGIHSVQKLFRQLQQDHGAPTMSERQEELLKMLDDYEALRYPNLNKPTEVGNDDWPEIEALVGTLCRSMPQSVQEALGKVVAGRKAGRVLMRRPINGRDEPDA
jgi:HEPN domain-containing protein